MEGHVHLVTKGDIWDMISNKEIRKEILTDDERVKLKKCIMQGELNDEFKGVDKHLFDEFSVADGLILKGNRIFIPRKLR